MRRWGWNSRGCTPFDSGFLISNCGFDEARPNPRHLHSRRGRSAAQVQRSAIANGVIMNVIVIKLGGAAGVDAEAVLADVAALAAEGQPVILVHGTSAAADALAQRAGVPVRHITSPSGHISRYTDPDTLELYVAAAAGQVNKRLVASLQQLGCNALGLSGVDGRLLVARRKD